ncbi:50S ribosomal protein L10 [Candidatus Haliotispira prima]|uniref:Large ribosomal subunit protein uL10 n=1 Tax=Candidatus Haliotispira prima TaxID=3034016 RepID=A0ABY8MJQ0_9SPIO|nr:50S ribosomal protein L10 [Candidatus Haliotispira prima]
MEVTKKVQQYKKDAVAGLRELLSGCNNYVFVDYRGLTVKEITNLRRKLREEGAKFHVIKNNYLKLALDQEEKPYEEGALKGPTAIAVMSDDAGTAVKAIVEFPREQPLEMKSGAIDGRLFDRDRLIEFSKLPSKAELIAQLLGTLNAPAQQTVGVMNASLTQLLYALNAIKEKQEA